MKALAICGSPRQGGNTEFLLRTLLTEIEKQGIETEFLSLRDKTILPCRGCYGCRAKKGCVQSDDFAAVYERMLASDAIIIGSPVYISRPTALLSPLLERVAFMARTSGQRSLSGKVGAPVTVARRAGETFAFAELLLWYFINDMIIPGSTYWNVGLAGAKGAKDAAQDLEGIEIMKHSAGNIVRLLNALQNAGKS
jgi:multimeric flavodoxin WrbA